MRTPPKYAVLLLLVLCSAILRVNVAYRTGHLHGNLVVQKASRGWKSPFILCKNGVYDKLKNNIKEKYALHGSLNDYIYKLLIKKFKKVKQKRSMNVYKTLKSAKSSYNVDLLFSCNFSISEIKQKLVEYTYELKLVDADNFKIVYLGKRRLVRPIKKQMEAYYLLFSFEIYPSMIKEVSNKFKLQDHVLRFIIIKNEEKSRTLEFSENDIVKDSLSKIEQNFFKKSTKILPA
ncbi:30S ribosomal protein S6, putative [Plasmodium malariae]|uniref:30S ribosomal protein S6, putative n=2 Tax=Plasmodium (Plasmodium) TaxID=418103 RepID=A0A1A8VXP7_PLAMA|nr:30S ribosomal protein S6, putative [Plasmodium malariae]SBS84132.1 30S ribosomal protein S6, putative (RPS6) [Plasmodium malariae]SBT87981.1 30S ribosomal protein S6, putative [Plasmodium malariae]